MTAEDDVEALFGPLAAAPPTAAYGVGQFRSASAAEWLAVLQQLSDSLQAICRTELIRADVGAQRILRSAAEAKSPEEFNAQLDLLGFRVAELLAIKNGDATAAGGTVLKFGSRGRASLRNAENQHADLAAEAGALPARTFLKL
jgi:hypothetical protein